MGQFFNAWLEAMELTRDHIRRGLPKDHIRYKDFKPVQTWCSVAYGLRRYDGGRTAQSLNQIL
jgi:hypothetical protein